MACWHPWDIDKELADCRARFGIFVLEDLEVKRALEKEGIEVRRIRGEREVRLVLPKNWSIMKSDKVDTRIHFICNPSMEPIFVTFSAHYTELPSRGFVKRMEDRYEDIILDQVREDITFDQEVNIEKTLKVNEYYYDGYESVLIWNKLPGVYILCTLDKKPICEMFWSYPNAFVRKRKDEESYTVGKIEEIEDDEKDYDGPRKTHKSTIHQWEDDFVKIDEFLNEYSRKCEESQ